MRRVRTFLGVAVCLVAAATRAAGQSAEDSSGAAARVEARIRALQREADQLAGRARTLIGELRALEITRDLRSAEAAQADLAAREASQALASTRERLAALERERIDRLPGLEAQLVALYKGGAAGDAALLFSAGDVRGFGRTSRALAAAAARNQRRIDDHRRTLADLRAERAALEERAAAVRERHAQANRTRVAAVRAVRAHAARIAEIDSRRDLAAQYVGELRTARDALLKQLDRPASDSRVPLMPFKGALEWPVAGTVAGRFGQPANRLGGSAVRNGVEIVSAVGTPVRAVHGGTVAYADAFTGFGTLVIIDHGANDYSLYGYLGAASVAAGQAVEPGGDIGQVGASPAGPPALYFEMRIDGRSVDPVQWLEPR